MCHKLQYIVGIYVNDMIKTYNYGYDNYFSTTSQCASYAFDSS